MKNEFYKIQKNIYQFIKTQKINKLVESQKLGKLFNKTVQETRSKKDFKYIEKTVTNQYIEIEVSDVKQVIKKLRIRKSKELDSITNKLLKYGGESLLHQLTSMMPKSFNICRILEDWQTSTTI